MGALSAVDDDDDVMCASRQEPKFICHGWGSSKEIGKKIILKIENALQFIKHGPYENAMKFYN